MTHPMSDDHEGKGPPGSATVNSEAADASDGDSAATAFAAEQRRGRERLIGMWRAAVRGVTEAAQRAAAQNDLKPAPQPVVAAEPTEDSAPAAEPTWVLPPRRVPGGSGN